MQQLYQGNLQDFMKMRDELLKSEPRSFGGLVGEWVKAIGIDNPTKWTEVVMVHLKDV